MYHFFDIPVDKAGIPRLSTEKPYCIHCGNILEDWMVQNTPKDAVSTEVPERPLPVKRFTSLPYII